MTREQFTVANAKIIPSFRNFSGVEKRNKNTNKIVNGAGKRNFCIEIDDDFANELADKFPPLYIGNFNNEERNPYIQLEVTLDNPKYKSKIFVGNSPDKMYIADEEIIDQLDWADIAKAQVVFNASPYVYDGEERVKLYVKNLYILYEQDEFASQYNIVNSPARDEFEETPFDEE